MEPPSKRLKRTLSTPIELTKQALLSAPEIVLPGDVTEVKSVEDEDATIGVVLQYHCDFCGTDITNNIRIRCNECRDFDLCVECFCKGSEKDSHLNTHSYIPVGHNNFSLFTKEWNADEELMLLEGVSKFGLGNWAEVADLVAPHSTSRVKKKDDCEKHYLDVCLNSRTKPLPDISRILAAPASSLESDGKEVWLEDYDDVGLQKGQFGSAADAAVATGIHVDVPHGTSGIASAASIPASLPKPQLDAGGKPHGQGSLTIGYMPLRGDFDVEYDNDAELILADIEFREDDPPHEKELKLKVLSIYNSKLDERIIRKRTIIERNLLDVRRLQIIEKRRTKEERELHALLKPLARFNIEANHDRLVSLLLDERRLWARILMLQEWRSIGLKTSREVKTYEEEKRRRKEALAKCSNLSYVFEGAARTQKNRGVSQKMPAVSSDVNFVASQDTTKLQSGSTAVQSAVSDVTGKTVQPAATGTPLLAANAAAGVSNISVELMSNMRGVGSKQSAPLPVRSLPGAEICTEKELEFCQEIQLAPIFFLMAKSCLLHEMQKNNGLTGLDKPTFSKMLRLDATRSGPIYDFVLDTKLVLPGDIANDKHAT